MIGCNSWLLPSFLAAYSHHLWLCTFRPLAGEISLAKLRLTGGSRPLPLPAPPTKRPSSCPQSPARGNVVAHEQEHLTLVLPVKFPKPRESCVILRQSYQKKQRRNWGISIDRFISGLPKVIQISITGKQKYMGLGHVLPIKNRHCSEVWSCLIYYNYALTLPKVPGHHAESEISATFSHPWPTSVGVTSRFLQEQPETESRDVYCYVMLCLSILLFLNLFLVLDVSTSSTERASVVQQTLSILLHTNHHRNLSGWPCSTSTAGMLLLWLAIVHLHTRTSTRLTLSLWLKTKLPAHVLSMVDAQWIVYQWTIIVRSLNRLIIQS